MKKTLLLLLTGFILAQGADYGACELVNVAQRKCYPLRTEGKQEEYNQCMSNNFALKASRVVGFNFIYTGRDLIFGY